MLLLARGDRARMATSSRTWPAITSFRISPLAYKAARRVVWAVAVGHLVTIFQYGVYNLSSSADEGHEGEA